MAGLGTHGPASESPPNECASTQSADYRGEKILRKNEFVQHRHKQRPKRCLWPALAESATPAHRATAWVKNAEDKLASALPKTDRRLRRSSCIHAVRAPA